jgi:hypothetical protein
MAEPRDCLIEFLPIMPNMCPRCYRLSATACEARRVCEFCGADLAARSERMSKNVVRRSSDYTAHPIEECFTSSLFVCGTRELTHDAATLLQYVRGLVTIAREVVDFGALPNSADPAAGLQRIAVHGFLTGSLDLLWLMRERIGSFLPGRVGLSRGFAHKKARADDEPTRELNDALLKYKSLGADRLVIVDEVVGGGQLSADLNAVEAWIRNNGGFEGGVLALGVTALRSKKLEKARTMLSTNHQWADIHLIRVPELIAQDDKGIPIKPVMSISTKYVPYRFWSGSYHVRCSRTLDGCSYRSSVASSTGSSYASTVRAICKSNPNRPGYCWPEKCCSNCAVEIEIIRREYADMPVDDQDGKIVGRVGALPSPRIIVATSSGRHGV